MVVMTNNDEDDDVRRSCADNVAFIKGKIVFKN